MTQRDKIVEIATSYNGVKKGSKGHHEIIDTFNKWKPDGYTGQYSDEWCAEFATACIYKAGLKSLVRGSANCGAFINKAKADGIWQENDGYIPDPGDLILYDWQDSGKGDNTGSPDHIGIVVQVKGNSIIVIEGNMTQRDSKGRVICESICGYRTISINGRYIRGFITPKYDKGVVKRPEQEKAKADTSKKTETSNAVAINQKYKVLPSCGMNVRKKPTTASKIVGGIPWGKTFTATKKQGNWVYSSYYKGWVCIKDSKETFLKKVK